MQLLKTGIEREHGVAAEIFALRHAEIETACAALEENPAVLLVEEVAGATGDLLVRVAATSTDDLQQVVHSILSTPGVVSTPIAPPIDSTSPLVSASSGVTSATYSSSWTAHASSRWAAPARCW